MKKRTLNSDVKLAVAALLCCASTYTHAEMTCKMIPGPGGIMQEQCTSERSGGGGSGGSGGATPVIGVGNGGGSSNTGGGGGGGGGSPGTNEPTPEQKKAEEEKRCLAVAEALYQSCDFTAIKTAKNTIKNSCGSQPNSTTVEGNIGIGNNGVGGSVTWENYNRCRTPIIDTQELTQSECRLEKAVRAVECVH
ncbi:hypothetical protein [Pseudoalteromonas aurantia]|nr:hypothetical protein [Pseudoalteromonas aurantia]